MNRSDFLTIVWIVLAIALVARAAWVIRKYDSRRVKRYIGWPVDATGTLGKFYWREGVFSSEVTRAMSPDYATKYRWLLSQRGQRTAVVLNVASWALCLFGALDLPWNLGFGGTLLSWWFLLVIVAYLIVRGSVRVIADAPDDLLDERQIALRNGSYRLAYIWLALIMFLAFGLMSGIGEAAADAPSDPSPFSTDSFMFGAVLLMFIAAALPSMVLAWGGRVKER
ncbi:MAG: hypothetical protein ACKOI3_02060 [Actinomycetota bacterium]